MKAKERNKPINENWIKSETHDYHWQAQQLLKKAKQIESTYKGRKQIVKIEKGYAIKYLDRELIKA